VSTEMAEVIAEEVRDLPAVRAHEAMVTRAEVSVDDVVEQRDKIKAVMERVMRPDIHYGRIPGVDKPTLFKPGAELLNTTFRLAPAYQSERIFHDDGHLTVVAKCVLTHAPSGIVLGEGEGLCSSRESKYAYRNAKRICPACGAEAIIKGKAEFGGGWLCWKKQDGCGAKFPDNDPAIMGQEVGKTDNAELPDTWNTVLKMADKRALVAAVLNCTAASDIFTQDIEDSPAVVSEREPRATQAAPEATSSRATSQPSRSEPPITEPQKKKANVLVGQLRDELRLQTAEVYLAASHPVPHLGDGETLHWSPLRDRLTKKEATRLIDRLEAYASSESLAPPVVDWMIADILAAAEVLGKTAEAKDAIAEKIATAPADEDMQAWLVQQLERARKAAEATA